MHVRWSKTNQFQSKSLDIPLPRLQHHRLCPVQAIFHAARQTAGADPFGPAFLCVIGGNGKPLTSEQFIVRIRQCLEAAGIPSSNIASHSFRRGGATFGYSIGLFSRRYQTVRGLALQLLPTIHIRRFSAAFPNNSINATRNQRQLVIIPRFITSTPTNQHLQLGLGRSIVKQCLLIQCFISLLNYVMWNITSLI